VIRHAEMEFYYGAVDETAPRAWAAVLRMLLRNDEDARTLGAAPRRTAYPKATL